LGLDICCRRCCHYYDVILIGWPRIPQCLSSLT
jgi:hypothetical protein